MSSADAFKFDLSQILSFGKELRALEEVLDKQIETYWWQEKSLELCDSYC